MARPTPLLTRLCSSTFNAGELCVPVENPDKLCQPASYPSGVEAESLHVFLQHDPRGRVHSHVSAEVDGEELDVDVPEKLGGVADVKDVQVKQELVHQLAYRQVTSMQQINLPYPGKQYGKKTSITFLLCKIKGREMDKSLVAAFK